MKEIWIVWAQYGDKSGSAFIAAYENEDKAQHVKDLICKARPSMDVNITPLAFYENAP